MTGGRTNDGCAGDADMRIQQVVVLKFSGGARDPAVVEGHFTQLIGHAPAEEAPGGPALLAVATPRPRPGP
jgi:hypothetical protein